METCLTYFRDRGELPSSLMVESPTKLEYEPIASGAFGKVYKCTFRGRLVAVKQLYMKNGETRRANLVGAVIVSEWMPQGTLRQYVRDNSALTVKVRNEKVLFSVFR